MNGETCIRKTNDAYADNVDIWGGKTGAGNEAAANTMAQLQDGAQKWSDLQDVIAACTAFQKCLVQILCHKVVQGSLVIKYEYEYNMELKDSMGARTKIKFLSADKPNSGLGFNLCLDGNQLHGFEARKKKVNQM